LEALGREDSEVVQVYLISLLLAFGNGNIDPNDDAQNQEQNGKTNTCWILHCN